MEHSKEGQDNLEEMSNDSDLVRNTYSPPVRDLLSVNDIGTSTKNKVKDKGTDPMMSKEECVGSHSFTLAAAGGARKKLLDNYFKPCNIEKIDKDPKNHNNNNKNLSSFSMDEHDYSTLWVSIRSL